MLKERLGFNPVTEDNPNPNRKYPATMRAVSFTSHGCKLLGTLFIAEGERPNPTLLLLHGFPGNETNFDIAHATRRAGWNVFVFHFRGIAGSEGEFSWAKAIEDTKAAVDFLRSEHCKNEFKVDTEKLVVAGHSMGGFLSLITVASDNELKNVGSLAGFNYGLFGSFVNDNKEARELTLQSLVNSVPFIRGKSAEELLNDMVVNKNEWNLLNYLPQLCTKNVLLVGAEYDTISINEFHHFPLAKAFEKAVNKNCKILMLKSGHSFSDKRIELTQILINWLDSLEL